MSAISRFFYISNVNKLRLKTVIYIAFFWTVIDYVIVLLRTDEQSHTNSIWFREVFMFIISLFMGYLFVYRLRKMSRRYPLWLNFLLKSAILLGSAFVLTFIIQYVTSVFIFKQTAENAFSEIEAYALHKNWLLQKIIYWMIVFFVTQLILIINEKYSPGVFIDILRGKYTNPKIEKRIVMFIDLKDSTPIAEKLGHAQYFEFIRDFIYRVSQAIIEFDGTIYQYVGDEVVCSWIFEGRNTRKCLDAVIESRKNIQKKSGHFRRKYGIVPEFRVGIHLGEVTVGEIGVIKKDLAMSGDTMNTTARIRSACNELNHHFIVSKAFVDNIDLKEWQTESLGMVDLKGKGSSIELFTLKI
ncbi:MAG: adenylate/guanylate cyclase domain-containing protein [Ginsengibacter sp.]